MSKVSIKNHFWVQKNRWDIQQRQQQKKKHDKDNDDMSVQFFSGRALIFNRVQWMSRTIITVNFHWLDFLLVTKPGPASITKKI